MNFSMKNTGNLTIPLYAHQGGAGLLEKVEPGDSYQVDKAGFSVINLGYNPTAVEEFSSTVEVFAEGLHQLIDRILSRPKAEAEGVDDDEDYEVQATITNHGPNELRVLLGSNIDERVLHVDESADLTAPGYIEIRELGV